MKPTVGQLRFLRGSVCHHLKHDDQMNSAGENVNASHLLVLSFLSREFYFLMNHCQQLTAPLVRLYVNCFPTFSPPMPEPQFW
jgi:hypothetical protein